MTSKPMKQASIKMKSRSIKLEPMSTPVSSRSHKYAASNDYPRIQSSTRVEILRLRRISLREFRLPLRMTIL
jgi:hypothetical protein